VLGSHLGHGPVRRGNRLGQPLAKPGGQPGAGRDLHHGLRKRPPPARRLLADQTALAPPQRHLLVGHRKVPDPDQGAVLHPPAGLPAIWAESLPVNGFNDDLDQTIGDTYDVDDPEAVQAEQ
jgi:hypothetical protein